MPRSAPACVPWQRKGAGVLLQLGGTVTLAAERPERKAPSERTYPERRNGAHRACELGSAHLHDSKRRLHRLLKILSKNKDKHKHGTRIKTGTRPLNRLNAYQVRYNTTTARSCSDDNAAISFENNCCHELREQLLATSSKHLLQGAPTFAAEISENTACNELREQLLCNELRTLLH